VRRLSPVATTNTDTGTRYMWAAISCPSGPKRLLMSSRQFADMRIIYWPGRK